MRVLIKLWSVVCFVCSYFSHKPNECKTSASNRFVGTILDEESHPMIYKRFKATQRILRNHISKCHLVENPHITVVYYGNSSCNTIDKDISRHFPMELTCEKLSNVGYKDINIRLCPTHRSNLFDDIVIHDKHPVPYLHLTLLKGTHIKITSKIIKEIKKGGGFVFDETFHVQSLCVIESSVSKNLSVVN